MIDKINNKWGTTFESGAILLNEHTMVPVLVCSRSELSVRLVLLDADVVPDIFLFELPSLKTLRVCKTVLRTSEVIEAWYDDEI
ncbi:hypothetical protein [Methylobacterium sp. 10]|uniref:hypothetical protein n=1 Tax=Methylobacterium sp. 10 TaxID=1101191 RepID=UPI0012DDE9D2|nr:hypothetical protein [Methylobacterium sp. 10]